MQISLAPGTLLGFVLLFLESCNAPRNTVHSRSEPFGSACSAAYANDALEAAAIIHAVIEREPRPAWIIICFSEEYGGTELEGDPVFRAASNAAGDAGFTGPIWERRMLSPVDTDKNVAVWVSAEDVLLTVIAQPGQRIVAQRIGWHLARAGIAHCWVAGNATMALVSRSDALRARQLMQTNGELADMLDAGSVELWE